MTPQELHLLVQAHCDPGTVPAWQGGYWKLTTDELLKIITAAGTPSGDAELVRPPQPSGPG